MTCNIISEKELFKYWNWLQEGKSSEDVKRDLLIRGVQEQEASKILNSLDILNFNMRLKKEASFHSRSYRIVGLILIITSLGLAVFTLLNSIFSISHLLYLSGGITSGFVLINYANRLNSKGIISKARQNRLRRF